MQSHFVRGASKAVLLLALEGLNPIARQPHFRSLAEVDSLYSTAGQGTNPSTLELCLQSHFSFECFCFDELP
jgi:hypothetical protein